MAARRRAWERGHEGVIGSWQSIAAAVPHPDWPLPSACLDLRQVSNRLFHLQIPQAGSQSADGAVGLYDRLVMCALTFFLRIPHSP